MKKIVIYSSIFVLFIGFLWACKSDFLEEEPKGFLSGETLANAAGVEAALIGAYAVLDGHNDGANNWTANPHNWIMGSITSDDAYKGSEQTDFPEFTQLEIYQWSANNGVINPKWVMLYEGVVRSNTTISLLNDATDVSEDNAKRIRGEALFLRSYYHFELYKVWGHVPYFTEKDTEFIKSNEGVSALDSAIADVEAAIALLPESQAQVGRVNQIAARAFAGKLYLYGPAKNPTKAKEHLDIVASKKKLARCFKEVFQMTTDNNEEILFAVQASINDGGNANNANWLNQLAYPGGGGSFSCCGFHQPSQDLVNAYQVDPVTGLPMLNPTDLPNPSSTANVLDPRIDFTIGRDEVPFLDWGIHAPNWIRDRAFSGPYSPKKFAHYKANPSSQGGWNNNATNAINYPIIRLADAILLLAEAEVMLGNLSRAQELVNMIRERAGNCAQGGLVDGGGPEVITDNLADPAITWATYKVETYPAGHPSFASAAAAMEAVRLERRLELALEGHRFFDLRRWNYDEPGYAATILNTFTSRAGTDWGRSYYKDAETYEAKHEWYPIPTPQINANTVGGERILKQNAGW